jgi:hypothetical protein
VSTATLQTAERDGMGAANRRVRVLEHTIDPEGSGELLAKQRAKSFARVVEPLCSEHRTLTHHP